MDELGIPALEKELAQAWLLGPDMENSHVSIWYSFITFLYKSTAGLSKTFLPPLELDRPEGPALGSSSSLASIWLSVVTEDDEDETAVVGPPLMSGQ